MATYYNKTSGPLPVTLRNGESTSVPAKSNLLLTADEDGSSSIAYHVQKGHLVRVGAPVAAVVAAPVAAAVAVQASLPVEAAPVVGSTAAAVVSEINKAAEPAEPDLSAGPTSTDSAVLQKKKAKL